MGRASSNKRHKREARATAGATSRARQVSEPVIAGNRTARVLGSDVRSRVVHACLLCGAVAALKLGHVAPRWAGLWIKQEGYVQGHYRSKDLITKNQDIPKHYFFCADCEQYLGQAENYLSRLTRGTAKDIKLIHAELYLAGDLPFLRKPNARLILRGLAGIVLKAHLSPHQLYSSTTLSKAEVAELKRAIMMDRYPASRFAVYAQKLFNRTVPGANARASLFIDQVRRHGGVATHIQMGGMPWTIYLGPAQRWREDFINDVPEDVFLSERRDWAIVAGEWILDPHHSFGFDPAKLARLRAGNLILPDDDCPCGLGLPFQECCAGRWLHIPQWWCELPRGSLTVD